MAVVDIWYKGSSRSPPVMKLVRQLHFKAATTNFHVAMSHIPGHLNSYADLVSRNLQAQFHQAAPQADINPTPVPDKLWLDLLPA